MTQTPSRQANPAWKAWVALVSLTFAVAVWVMGLADSFNRPSVTPALSLQQQEMALLAEPAVPEKFRSLLVGQDPKASLMEALREIPLDQMTERQRLLLAGLQPSGAERGTVLAEPFEAPALRALQDALLSSSAEQGKGLVLADQQILQSLAVDPLLNQVGCFALGGAADVCLNSNIASSMALRLALSETLPAVALLLGLGLLLYQLWRWFRKTEDPWQPLVAIPLSITDMVILVAGGFVVLGEVMLPLVVAPLSAALTKGLVSPLSDAVTVLIGYCALAIAPLLILRQQLQGLDKTQRPLQGWLQWRLRPWLSALCQGGRGWLMVMPPVLLTGWLMGLLLGDQGGSNPLLEMVLRSKDPLALLLLATTAVVLAPLFEEVVFRGVLLPVLASSLGRAWGVFASALVFGVAHLSVGELPPLVVLGIGLGLLRLSSGRLLPCVLMHALWNGVTFANLLLLA